MNANDDMMFSSRTDDELLAWYNGAVKRARASGLKFTQVKEFAERQALIDTCQALHNDMVLHEAAKQAQVAPQPQPNGEGRVTDQEPSKSSAPTPPPPKKEKGKSKAPKNTAKASAPAEKPIVKENTMAQAATATAAPAPKGRKAAAAPAVPAKKGRKAAAQAPAPEPKEREPRRTDFDDNAKITWNIGKGEPIPGAREGSAKWARWDLIRQHNGKKVSVFKANGGNLTSLANAVEKEAASVG